MGIGKTVAYLALIVMIFMGISFVFLSQKPQTEAITNITIKEKYQSGIIPGYRSNTYIRPKIVDENGNLYQIIDERIWAKMEVDKTYAVRVYTIYGDKIPRINAVKVGDIWYSI